MKEANVKVGEVYVVKVSEKLTSVVMDEEQAGGGWVGTNQKTHRQHRVKTGQRVRCLRDDYLARGDAGHSRWVWRE